MFGQQNIMSYSNVLLKRKPVTAIFSRLVLLNCDKCAVVGVIILSNLKASLTLIKHQQAGSWVICRTLLAEVTEDSSRLAGQGQVSRRQ